MSAARRVLRAYEDPLDRIWIATAAALGWRVRRDRDVYASFDGAGTLTIGARDTLDADDSLAQMILHEIGHALVQGEDAWTRRDFGLDNRSDADVPRERACLVVQALLADRHGLRGFLAPTTDARAEWDEFGEDPRAAASAQERAWVDAALERERRPPFAPYVERALQATAKIVAIARGFPGGGGELPSLYEA